MRNFAGFVATLAALAAAYATGRYALGPGPVWLLPFTAVAFAAAGIATYYLLLGVLLFGRWFGRQAAAGWRESAARR
jgi:hypothetical protein